MNATQTKTLTSPADVMATYFESWRAKDFESLRSILADDVTFVGPMGTAANADECVEGIRRLSQITDEVVVKKTFVDGPDVLTWFELRTKIAPPAQVANWSHIENGKVVRIRVTFDPREILAGG